MQVSEIEDLSWPQVDIERSIVSFELGTTKNDEARIVYLDNELQGILENLWESRKATIKEAQSISP